MTTTSVACGSSAILRLYSPADERCASSCSNSQRSSPFRGARGHCFDHQLLTQTLSGETVTSTPGVTRRQLFDQSSRSEEAIAVFNEFGDLGPVDGIIDPKADQVGKPARPEESVDGSPSSVELGLRRAEGEHVCRTCRAGGPNIRGWPTIDNRDNMRKRTLSHAPSSTHPRPFFIDLWHRQADMSKPCEQFRRCVSMAPHWADTTSGCADIAPTAPRNQM